MYNRYIPQDDGSYRRSRMQDPCNPPPPPPPEPCGQTSPPPKGGNPQQSPCPPNRPAAAHHNSPAQGSQGLGVGKFFRQLLPKDFCTEDLLIILMLLLITGDCQEDKNSALLTLALYLFL